MLHPALALPSTPKYLLVPPGLAQAVLGCAMSAALPLRAFAWSRTARPPRTCVT